MGFRGQAFALESPAAAVEAMVTRLLASGLPRRTEACGLEAARGRVLAMPVAADRDSPAFDHSAMDGFAVRLADLASGAVTLRIEGEVRIGREPPVLPAGPSAVRIVTGGGIPLGADAVVKREDVTEHGGLEGAGGGASITIDSHAARRVRSGDHIRRRGENARAGAEVLAAGTLLSASALGSLASVGVAAPNVFARLKVAVITTGDELVPPSSSPGTYQTRNSNAATLRAALSASPWLEVVSVEHADDDGERLTARLGERAAAADAVILTGGVSMGHRDPVRAAVEAIDAEILFHGLPQRPGKPMLGAVLPHTGGSGGVAIFGLPGNPVSALVTCVRIVTPVLGRLAGLARTIPPTRVALTNHDGKSLELWWHRPVRVTCAGEAELVDGRGSGDTVGAGRSDGFIEVPPTPRAGDGSHTLFDYYPWPA